jgi:hypothetical protein
MVKWGKIGAPKSAKRKAWLATLRGKKKGTKRVRSPRRVTTTRRQTTVARKKTKSRRKKTIPLGVVLGVGMPLANEVLYNVSHGYWENIPNALLEVMTGYSLKAQNWDMARMLKFWLPAGIGFAAHKLAGMFGINRALARAGIPYIRI